MVALVSLSSIGQDLVGIKGVYLGQKVPTDFGSKVEDAGTFTWEYITTLAEVEGMIYTKTNAAGLIYRIYFFPSYGEGGLGKAGFHDVNNLVKGMKKKFGMTAKKRYREGSSTEYSYIEKRGDIVYFIDITHDVTMVPEYEIAISLINIKMEDAVSDETSNDF